MLLKLRTPGCVIVGALCVVLSVFEPVRWLPWDMLAAVVVCMVTVRFVVRQRVAAVLSTMSTVTEKENHNGTFYQGRQGYLQRG